MKLYVHYLKVYMRSIMQYKMSFILTAIGQFFSAIFIFIGILFLFNRFNTISGFSLDMVLITYSNVLLSFSLAEFLARGFDIFPMLLSNGTFDRMLVRPRNVIFQIFAATFELTRVGKVLQAIAIYIYVLCTGGVNWSFVKILILCLMNVCGIILFILLFIINATVAFFTTEGLEIFNIFTDGSKQFGAYPLSVYGNKVLKFYTFVIPLACIQYYPLLYLFDKSDNIYLGLTPLVALIFGVPATLCWKVGLKKYKSTGS